MGLTNRLHNIGGVSRAEAQKLLDFTKELKIEVLKILQEKHPDLIPSFRSAIYQFLPRSLSVSPPAELMGRASLAGPEDPVEIGEVAEAGKTADLRYGQTAILQ